jgi:hypothetical protein
MPLPPTKLNERHRLIAFMKLGGAGRDEIATALDYEPTYVSAITESPMFKALMDHLRAEMRHKTVGSVVDRIIAEGPASIETLVTLRDHAESEQVRTVAARDLLDRNPDTAKVSREDRRVETRIVIDSRALARIAGVMAEDGGTVAEPQPLDVTLPPAAARPAGYLTLEAAVAALAAQEEASNA